MKSRLRTRFYCVLPLLAARALWAGEFTLPASPSTVVWGYYAARSNPALTVKSGDTVRMQTLSTCNPERMQGAGVHVPQYDLDIHAQVTDKGPGAHILTGPVAIEDAEPGDDLEVQIQRIDIDVPFACNSFGPGRGFLPNDFPYGRTKVIPLDLAHMIGRFAPGIDIPLRPFFGSMGVAPEGGARLNSAPPWMHA